MRRAAPYPIGVDVGFDALRMVQLAPAEKGGGGGLRIVAAVERPLPAGVRAPVEARVTAAADALGQVLRERHFRGRRVVAALPRELVHVRPLRLPPMPDADLAWAVSADARDLFPFDTAKARLQFLDAGEVRQGVGAGTAGGTVRRELLVVAAGEALVDGFLEQLHRAGAVVNSLDIEPCAAYRAACFASRGTTGVDGMARAIVDVGAGRSQVLVGRGSQLRVVRLIEVGGRHLNQAVARKLGIAEDEAGQLRRRLAEAPGNDTRSAQPPRDSVRRAVSDATRGPVESLAREAALALRYHAVAFRGAAPDRAWLAGTEAGDPFVRSALAIALPCPLEPADFACDFRGESEGAGGAALPGGSAPWAIALGLALRRVVAPTATAAAPRGPAELPTLTPATGAVARGGAQLRTTAAAEASHV